MANRQDQKLGYILKLIPNLKSYAINRSHNSFGKFDSPFLGITSILKEAHVWKTQKQAKEAIADYLEWLIDDYYKGDSSQVKIAILALTKDSQKQLKTQLIEELSYSDLSAQN